MRARENKQEGLFKELKSLAEQSGFGVRCEKLLREAGFRVKSGSCSVNGKKWVILDRSLPPRDRIDLLADEIRDAIPETAEIPSSLQKYLAHPTPKRQSERPQTESSV